ncbi:hypothetical protein KEJ21_02395 [Candidatus Bathyarchaeota archaeon]|nr:hypothetical protein [Candidatus Bathyarchaeota archaeon]
MDKKVASIIVIALLAVSASIVLVNASSITVTTDKERYVPGEIVRISGITDPNSEVLIKINNTLGLVFVTNVTSTEEGNYSTEFRLPVCALLGDYTVTATLSSSSTVKAETSFTVVMRLTKSLAEKLISMSNLAKARVEAVFEELEENNAAIPEDATSSYEDGVELLDESMDLFEEELYTESVNKALQALQEFNTALRLAKAVERMETEEEGEEQRLRVAIDRAYAFLDKLEEMADKLEENGFDVSDLRNNLTEAEQNLKDAEELLDSGDVSGAAQELAEARGILGRSMALISHIAKKFKLEKAEKFIEQCQNRFENMIMWLNRKGFGFTQQEVASALMNLNRIRMRLNEIRLRISSYDEDEIDDLGYELRNFSSMMANIYRKEIMFAYQWVERLEARVTVLNKSIEKLEARGIDAEDLKTKLDSLKNQLEEIRIRLREEYGESIRSRLEELESFLDNYDNLLKFQWRRHFMFKGRGEKNPDEG